MIDLHSHLLPGLDDGSRSVQQSVEVLRRFAVEGVRAVVLTPHIDASAIASQGEEHVERRAQAFAALRARAADGPALHLGFEIMLDQPMPTLALGDRRFALAGSRYYLVEFPPTVEARFTVHVLRQFSEVGLVPIVAHPERYEAGTPETLRAWRDAGARVQIDATTLTRAGVRGERARRLVAAGLGDLLAADNHGDGRSLLTGVRYLTDQGLADVAALLAAGNPGAVVQDGALQDPSPVELRRGLLERLRRLILE